ncbi:MAG: peptidase T, partial [bacterium]|nr:peptidase T [bacterium]
MKTVLERLLDYCSFDTQSDETTGTHPSTAKQRKLAEHLAEELRALKLENVRVTPECYVYAELPATSGFEHADALGFIAHMDTSDGASGANVRPQIIKNWDGSPIRLGSSGLELNTTLYPFMKDLIGHTLVTTDGTTLLGADDKAGIAEIMTAVETVQTQELPHGPLRIAFTPDEEIGEGPDFFDVSEFGAKYAYTIDGGAANEIEFQNFNAAEAKIFIRGRSVHPGSAKGIMINALKVAIEFDNMLPAEEVPAMTDGFQGFYHLMKCSGTV